MTIVNSKNFGFGKAFVALVTIVAFVVTTAPSVYGQSSVEELQRQLQALTAQLASLQGGSTSVTATVTQTTPSSVACPFSWSRNLGIGSIGEDVRKIQQFLNGDSDTQVAISGVGSAGSETTYYGRGSAAAVSRFQEKYASDILTPIGLSRGTGYFGTGTRAKANQLCSTGNVVTIPTAPDSIEGGNIGSTTGALVARVGENPRDGFAVLGAQRIPFTVFSLTAGNSAVQVNGITVQRAGISNDDFFESVALVDNRGFQLGSSRRLNRDSEAIIGGSFVVPRNDTIVFTIVGNVSDDVGDVGAGDLVQLNVVEIDADTSVSGVSRSDPIEGAVHAGSGSLKLSEVTVEARGSQTDTAEVSEEDVEFAKFRIGINSKGNEDALIKSITFENKGTLDLDDIDDLVVELDREEFEYIIDGDRLSVIFPGKGFEIEEGKNEELTITGVPTDGGSRTVRFEIDDKSDVYVIGARYRYGLPVKTTSASRTVTISRGEINFVTARRSSDDREIVYGDDRELAAFEIEVDEDHEFEDMIVQVVVNGLDNDALERFYEEDEELSIENIRLVDEDNNTVVSADDDVIIDVTRSGSAGSYVYSVDASDSNVEFSSGTLTVSDIDFNDVFDLERGATVLFLTGDLENDWRDEGIRIQWYITDFQGILAVDSDEEYSSSEIDTFVGASGIKGLEYRIKASSVEVDLGRVSNDDVVAGTDGVTFVEIDIDARDTVGDVEFESLTLFVKATGTDADVEDLDRCAVYNSAGDTVSGNENVDQASISGSGASAISTSEAIEFDLDDYTVDQGDEEELFVQCNLDRDITTDTKFEFFTTADNAVEYETDGNDETLAFGLRNSYGAITVKDSGLLTVTNETVEFTTVVATGSRPGSDDYTSTAVVEFRSENEDVEIDEIVLRFGDSSGDVENNLSGSSVDNNVENFISEVRLVNNDGRVVDSEDGSSITSAGQLTFDNLGRFVVEANPDDRDDNTLTVEILFEGIDDNTLAYSGVKVTTHLVSFEAEGVESSNEVNNDNVALDLSDTYVHRATPTIELARDTVRRTLNNGRVYYDFAVRNNADESRDEIVLGQFTFDVNLNDNDGAGELLYKEVKLFAYTDSGRNNEVRDYDNKGQVNTTQVTSAVDTEGEIRIPFRNDGLRVDAGDVVYFRLEMTVEGVENDDSVVLKMVADTAEIVPGTHATQAVDANKIVWSPNTDGDDDNDDYDETDWMNGYFLLERNDVDDAEYRWDE